MLILWLGTLVVVRYVAKEVFFRFSYHRGIWHSLLATVFCAFLTACDLQHAARPQRRGGVARRRLHVHRLPHAPDPRRDLFRRRDGHAHQGLVRHRAQACRLQAPGAFDGHGRRHRAGLPDDAAKQHVPREHHLARRCGAACSIACCRRRGGSASTGAARRGCPTCRSAPRPRPKQHRPPGAPSRPARSCRPSLRRMRSRRIDSVPPTAAAPARRRPAPGRRRRCGRAAAARAAAAMPNRAANSTLVSRRAATSAIGATVMAQMAMRVGRRRQRRAAERQSASWRRSRRQAAGRGGPKP